MQTGSKETEKHACMHDPRGRKIFHTLLTMVSDKNKMQKSIVDLITILVRLCSYSLDDE